MLNHPRRSMAQTVVAVSVLALLAMGVWFAATGSGDCARCLPCSPLTTLVPPGLDFVISTSPKQLGEAPWFRRNVLDDAAIPELSALNEALGLAFAAPELRVDRYRRLLVPHMAEFSLESDLLEGKLVVAGDICEGAGPEQGPPRWREIVVLKHISPRFADALDDITTDALRDLLAPMEVQDLGDGILEFTLDVAGSPPAAARQECGPGIVVPPENVWYGLRVGTALALANAEPLLREVARLARGGIAEETPSRVTAAAGSIAAHFDLHPLRNYLMKWMEEAEWPDTMLAHFFTIPALESLEGRIDGAAPDGLAVHAEVRYESSQLSPDVRDLYAGKPLPFREAASKVPAENTFAVLTARVPAKKVPRIVMNELFGGEFFGGGWEELWSQNLRRTGHAEEVARRWSEVEVSLDDTWTLALARRSEVLDAVDYDSFFIEDPVQRPTGRSAGALIARLSEGADPVAVSENLSALAPLLDGTVTVQTESYRSLQICVARLEVQIADYWWVQPCWAVAEDHLIVAFSPTYLRRIVDTLVAPDESPPLSTDATWQAMATHLPARANVGLFVDLAKLYQVPPDRSPGGQPRGFLWDLRHDRVFEDHHPRDEAIRYRKQLLDEYARANGKPPDAQARAEIEEQIDQHWEAWLTRYPEFEEAYRQHLATYGRLRGLGVTLVAESSTLRVDAWLGTSQPSEK